MAGFLVSLYIFVLAIFAGYELITRVPTLLHTPLMSGANAIPELLWSAHSSALEPEKRDWPQSWASWPLSWPRSMLSEAFW